MQTRLSTIAKEKSLSKIICLCCIILAAFLFYVMNATKHGLWYDEAVEYYYSKFLKGTVPGGLGTTNMYERIRITYQPPLYNVLMFIWLRVFDSEFTFRLAGILITIAGSIGVFFAINEMLPEGIWSNLGTLFYLFSYGTIYYALECAEYNLMMCFVSWTVFSFLRVLRKNDRSSIICFLVFSCLSVYSQYGAAFIVLGMGLTLMIRFILEKDFLRLKELLGYGIAVFLIAILPLLFLFIIPQIKHQEITSISHVPVFVRGFIVDFFIGGKETLEAMFGHKTVYGVLFLVIICMISLVFCFKKLIYPFIAVGFAWITYFFAVCCSFYGNKIWDKESIGSMNLGDRYSFFFIPPIVILLTVSLGLLTVYLKDKHISFAGISAVFFTLCITILCSFEICRTVISERTKTDDDVRELVLEWYDRGLYDSKTLIFQWDDALFNYYLVHDDRYRQSYSSSVESSDLWMRTADYEEVYDKLSEMGYLTTEEFYYVSSNIKDNPALLSVMKDAGYEAEEIYSGGAKLLHMTKSI